MRAATTEELVLHLSEFIKSFSPATKVERYLYFAQNPKRHSKITALLWHASLIERSVVDDSARPVIDRLRELGATDCVLIAPCVAAEPPRASFGGLEEGLQGLEEGPGIVSCTPGKLAYVQGEGAFERFLCVKR